MPVQNKNPLYTQLSGLQQVYFGFRKPSGFGYDICVNVHGLIVPVMFARSRD